MKLLAFDLGTTYGFAAGSTTKTCPKLHGSFCLASPKELRKLEHDEQVQLKLERWNARMRSIFSENNYEVVAFERVQSHSSVYASQLYGALMGVLYAVSCEHNARVIPCAVQSVKRHATGKGNARKAKMMEFAEGKFGVKVIDDNHADALWIWDFAKQKL
jgi:Holliday junction resolvasome RuvABC endonuclease subunit